MTSIVVLVVILIPTLLMGSSLPLLVTQVVRATGKVGRFIWSIH